jgi:hypothetical protein
VADATTVTRTVGGPLPQPVHLGTVLLDGRGMVIARLEGGCRPGQVAALFNAEGVPIARPEPDDRPFE